MTSKKPLDPSKIKLEPTSKEPDELTIKESNFLAGKDEKSEESSGLGTLGGVLIGAAITPTIPAMLIGGIVGTLLVKGVRSILTEQNDESKKDE